MSKPGLESGRIQEWHIIRGFDTATLEFDICGVAFGTVRVGKDTHFILGRVEHNGDARKFVKNYEFPAEQFALARAHALDFMARLLLSTVRRDNPTGNLGTVCVFKTKNPWMQHLLVEDDEVTAMAAEIAVRPKKEQTA